MEFNVSPLAKSPKSVALPKVAIVTKSITFEREPPPVVPPKHKPLIEFEADPLSPLATVISPKSAAFPVVAICTVSIVLTTDGLWFPIKTALVELELAAGEFIVAVKSPKSVALPVVEIVTY
jgi:hypothetical protein